MEQWQDAASRQLELLTRRLTELLAEGLGWLRSELGVDLGLKPELIPPWAILLAACSGLLLMAALWASVCRTVFRRRHAVGEADDGLEGKRGVKPLRAEEPKKKKKKAEKKAQPNGRAVAEPQEGGAAASEETAVPHHQPPPQVKTDKVAETKKAKKKAKPAVKETKGATRDGKEPEEGTWETKVSNKEKREQRKKDKGSSDGSASPGGGDTPVNAPPDPPQASAPPPANQKKKGESAKVKAEKADAVFPQANSSSLPAAAVAVPDAATKAAPKASSWAAQRPTASLWRADEPWAAPLSAAELKPLLLSGIEVPQQQAVSDLTWLSQPREDDQWSGLNGGSADPSSDWNAPSEAWGNYEEPSPEPPQAPEPPLPEPANAAEDDEEDKDKSDAATDGAAKSKKKKKKKKKTSEEGGTPGQVEEPVKEAAPAAPAKKPPPAQENAAAAAVQPVPAAAVQVRGDREAKDMISQKPVVTQVPQKPTDGEPAAKQNNLPAPEVQKKLEESQVPKPAKKKKARRET